ncbi:MAG TPA: VWA domain-containing protein, partial [Paracoccus sp. (in: a-proteobacteria)]|nr:VWA domain-containing protein [Paracoccus sp. (in: a-proteobacteria)]
MTQDRQNDPQDPLDRLSRALRDAAPPADRAARDRALARAMEKFDDLHQGNAAPMRPNQDSPRNGAGFLTGVRIMLTHLTSKPALAATTSVAALCLGLFIILPG